MNAVLPHCPTVRPLGVAAAATLATVLLLPFTELTGRRLPPPARPLTVETATLPPPEPPEQRLEPPPEPATEALASPELALPAATALAVQPVFDLGLDLGDFTGTLQTRFHIAANGIGGGMDQAVFTLDALDQPPQPRIQLKPAYPAFARARGIEGAVTVEFVVDPAGTTRDIEVVDSAPPGVFDQAARRAIERWRFNPGIRRGEAVAVRVRQRVTFAIE